MVRAKNTAGGCKQCCCRQCDAMMAKESKGCCPCACRRLCVKVRTTDPDLGTSPVKCMPDCGCVEKVAALTFDDARCKWVPGVNCGPLGIDMAFSVEKCGTQCYLCMLSNCMHTDVNGKALDCVDGSATYKACDTIDTSEDCGGLPRNCPGKPKQKQFVLGTFDASDCDIVNSTSPCGSFEVTAWCDDVIVPVPVQPESGTLQQRGTCDGGPRCINCDCVCEYLCITYIEGLGMCGDKKIVRYDCNYGAWVADFDCTTGKQRLILSIHEFNGCCYWHLWVEKGYVVPGFEYKRMHCPEADLLWDWPQIVASETGSSPQARVEVSCAYCGWCAIGIPCCPDTEIPLQLMATLLLRCGGAHCFTLYFQGFTSCEYTWYGKTLVQCDTAPPGSPKDCRDNIVELAFVCRCMDPNNPQLGWEAVIQYLCNGELQHESDLMMGSETNCDPEFCATDVPPLGFPDCPPAGAPNKACTNSISAVIIREHCATSI